MGGIRTNAHGASVGGTGDGEGERRRAERFANRIERCGGGVDVQAVRPGRRALAARSAASNGGHEFEEIEVARGGTGECATSDVEAHAQQRGEQSRGEGRRRRALPVAGGCVPNASERNGERRERDGPECRLARERVPLVRGEPAQSVRGAQVERIERPERDRRSHVEECEEGAARGGPRFRRPPRGTGSGYFASFALSFATISGFPFAWFFLSSGSVS